jgi:hypothetical protein
MNADHVAAAAGASAPTELADFPIVLADPLL